MVVCQGGGFARTLGFGVVVVCRWGFAGFYFVCGLIVLARFTGVGGGLRGGRLASCRCVWCA